MTKFVVSGYIGFDNFGDEAIAKVLTTYLKTQNPEKITVISSNPTKTSLAYGVNSVRMLDFINPVLESDVLISGGGSLLQDVTSLKSLCYYLAIIMLALVFNKKVIIFAQGFTPFRTKIGKFLTCFVLKRCDKIFVRDAKSQVFLESFGVQSTLISDPVFDINVPNIEKKKGVGIQLRSFSALNETFLDSLANCVSEKFKDEEIKLFSLQDSLDLPVLKYFGQKLTDCGLKVKYYQNLTVTEAVEELSKLEYLIGMRFHANLVAAKAGVKILGINYDVKVSTLAESVGFPTIEMDEKNICSKFEEVFKLDTTKYVIPKFYFPEL